MAFERSLLLPLLLLLGFALPLRAQDACLFSGMNAAPFGVNTRSTQLDIRWDPGTCSIETEVSAAVCCGAVVGGHAIVIGSAPLAVPIDLQPPFFPGSALYVMPETVVGPTTTTTASYPMPADPGLAGRAFFAQGVAIIFDPARNSTELGISQGMIAQLSL